MSEGLSEVGQARAWIHLALEKKTLSQHLKELLLNQELLRSGWISHDWPAEARFTLSLNIGHLLCLPTGSCTNLMRSCSLRRNESSSCSTCCLSTRWTISASPVSSPPSVSPVHLHKVVGKLSQDEGSAGAPPPPPGLRYWNYIPYTMNVHTHAHTHNGR